MKPTEQPFITPPHPSLETDGRGSRSAGGDNELDRPAEKVRAALAIRGPKSTMQTRVSFYDQLKFNDAGLIPAIIQDQSTGRVLMMAWMNRATIEKTIATGQTWFWSRSRKQFWTKGQTSGHPQKPKTLPCAS